MAMKILSQSEIDDLIGTAHTGTGMIYPPPGMQPYYVWLVNTLHRLAECSVPAFQVVADDTDTTTVMISPGRAMIGNDRLVYGGGVLQLSQYNNSTALIYLQSNSGEADIQVASDVEGWPDTLHLRLEHINQPCSATGIC